MLNGCAILLCAAILALTSCSRAGTQGEATGPLSSAALGVEMTLPSYPEGGEARVVNREGAVEVLRGPDSSVPESGVLLALGDRVRTGADGTLELRLGDLANILLLPGTEFELRTARLTPGASGVLLFLASGTALFDVRPLASRESFVVSTSRLLAGVRGTRFLVTAGEDSTAAVREGRVAVLPAGPTLERLVRAAAADAAAREALQTLTALAPDAGPGREIRVDGAAQERADQAYAKLEAFLSEQADLPLDAGVKKEVWLFSAGASEPLPADAAVRGALALARDAAAAVRPYLAVPASAGAETLSGFERFKSLRSGPLSPEAPAQKPARLPDHPALSGGTSLSSRPLAGSLVRVPDIDVFLAADEGGTLYAFDAKGTVLWRVRTGNRGDSRSYPVTYKGTVYYAGDAELLAVNGSDGAVLSRRALEPGRDPGARPSPFPDALLMPTAAGFDVLDPRSLEVKISVPVAGGPGTLPTQRDSFALVVSKEGVLLLMDPAAGTVRAQVQTGARGFTAVSPRIFEERACFADRTGLVVMVDLERMKVLWERRTGVEVLSDIELAREGVLVYGNGRLFGFLPDGEPLMPPLTGVSAPPLLSNGTVYYGTVDGNLVVAQVSPWRIRGTLPLGDALSARPLQMGDTLYIGTRGGRLVRVDTSKLPL